MADIEKVFEYAVRNGLKVRLQMENTPDGQYILFWPYAALDDLINGIEYLGLLERHYSDPNTGYLAWPILRCVKHVEVLDETFEQPERNTWFKAINFQRMKLLAEFDGQRNNPTSHSNS
jgi:hypothetical protein